MYLSVVVPCLNEEDVLPQLVERVLEATNNTSRSAEIILVDDGSDDSTWTKIEKASAQNPVVRGLKLSRNCGHQAALTAGLHAARGERIFMLDADLQDPPELLPEMLDMMDRGYDVVYGRRRAREGETMFKRLTAFIFYRILNALSDVEIPKDTGDFRLVSRRALDAVLGMPEKVRFVRGMFAWAGFSQIGLEYERQAREHGETKYPLSKMMRLAFDAVTSFSTRPLALATRLALFALFLAFLMAVYVIGSWWLYNAVAGWASTLLAISLFSGIQLLTLGIFGEYLGRIYTEVKHRPMYFVEEETGANSQTKNKRMERQK